MARFERRSEFSTNRPLQDCMTAAQNALALCGARDIMRLTHPHENPSMMSGLVGHGLAVRAIGTFYAPHGWVPLRLVVVVHDDGPARRVATQAEDNFGIGTLFGVRRRYESRCAEAEAELSHHLRQALQDT